MFEAQAKYLTAFTLGLRGALEYRFNFVASLLGVVSPVVIQIALWTTLYPARTVARGALPLPGGAARLFGFTFTEMLAYVVVANIVSCIVRTGFEYDINDDIRTGGLDRHLVKPIAYFDLRAAQFLGAKAAESAAAAFVLGGALGVLAKVTGFAPSIPLGFSFAAALAIALVLNFLIFWCVGLVGFWLTEVGFLFEAARIVIVTASGGVFPLAVLGSRVEAVFAVLPFRFTIQFPTDVLCGHLAAAEIVRGLGLGALWCVALVVLGRGLWTAGLRRFVAVEG